jgi:hypothetical protein
MDTRMNPYDNKPINENPKRCQCTVHHSKQPYKMGTMSQCPGYRIKESNLFCRSCDSLHKESEVEFIQYPPYVPA